MNARPFRNLLRNYDRDLLTPMWLAVMAISLLCATTTMAQVTTADIVGAVTDSAGGVVAGATLTAKNEGTGVSRTVQTGETGDYTFTLLLMEGYSISVEMKSFKTSVTHVILAVGDRARVVGSLITSKAVQDLPLNGRNFIQLVELAPGINPSLPDSMSSGTRPDDPRLASNYSRHV